MCDVIEMHLKIRKTAVEVPILKLGLPNFRLSFYFILLLVVSLL